MARPKGSKNKNVPSGIPHKHLINKEDEKISKECDELRLRESVPELGAENVPTVPQPVYEDMEKISQTQSDTTNENELPSVYTRLRQEGKDHKDALRGVRESKESSASPRLHEAVGSDMAMPILSHEITQKCSCGHDQELHYGGEKGHCNRMNCSCLEYK